MSLGDYSGRSNCHLAWVVMETLTNAIVTPVQNADEVLIERLRNNENGGKKIFVEFVKDVVIEF